MTLMVWFVVIFFLAIVNTIFSVIQLNGFLSRNPAIKSRQSLEEFKQIVRRQMYQALAQIGFLAIVFIMGLYGIFTHKLVLRDINT